MSKHIVLTFHKSEAEMEPVKGRTFDSFNLLDRVRRIYGAKNAYTVIVNTNGVKIALRPDGTTMLPFDKTTLPEWYLDTDIVEDEPRKVAVEPIKKKIRDLKHGEVFELEGHGRFYKSNSPWSDQPVAIHIDSGRAWKCSDYHEVVVLGYITFGSEGPLE